MNLYLLSSEKNKQKSYTYVSLKPQNHFAPANKVLQPSIKSMANTTLSMYKLIQNPQEGERMRYVFYTNI